MSRSIDAWDDEPRRPTTLNALGSTSSTRPKAAAFPIKDDWEDDDDEEEDAGRSPEDKNKQIWEDANTKEHHPMPALVISRGASTSVPTPTLPLNQPPPMRILKRPSASPSPSSTNLNTPTGETLQEREARYQAARERIFGSGAESGTETPVSANSVPTSTSTSTLNATTATKVVRNPRGPLNASSVSANGFAERKKMAPPNSSSVAAPTPSTNASSS